MIHVGTSDNMDVEIAHRFTSHDTGNTLVDPLYYACIVIQKVKVAKRNWIVLRNSTSGACCIAASAFTTVYLLDFGTVLQAIYFEGPTS